MFSFLKVSDGEANMSMGGLNQSPERHKLYDISFPYYSGSLMFAIPPGKPYTSLEKLFFPFDTIIWAYTSVLFAVAIFVIIWTKLIAKRRREFLIGRQNDAPFLNMINVCFGGVMNLMPKRNFARTMLLIWILSSMIIRNAYQGTLFSFLRGEQRNRPLYTLHDIFEGSNVRIYVWRARFQELYDNVPIIRHR